MDETDPRDAAAQENADTTPAGGTLAAPKLAAPKLAAPKLAAPKRKAAAGSVSRGADSGSPAAPRASIRKKKQVLLIVESPAKGKTIEKYLGKGYTVAASMGHLIDLPKSRLAIDVGNTFEPEYITVRGKAKIL